MQQPVRVFVGTSPDGDDAEAEIALEHSIKSRSSLPVEITYMRLTRDPASPWYSDPEHRKGHPTWNWVTPFSGLRWAIPKACGYQGRAIYCDVDTICLADIAELHNADMKGGVMMAKDAIRFCVMLIDCEKAKRFEPLAQNRKRGIAVPFPAGQNWNCLDGEKLAIGDPEMKWLHFTSIDSQPHIGMAQERLAKEGREHWYTGPVRDHWRPELTELWMREYQAALDAGLRLEDHRAAERFGPVPKRKLDQYKSRLTPTAA